MFRLIISDDSGRTTVVPLVHHETSIGRQASNIVRLTQRNISRNHARVIRRNGAFVVEDLGSYNGIRVNGRRVESECTINIGDRIDIGDYSVAMQGDTPVWSTPPKMVQGTMPPRLIMLGPPAPSAEFSLTKPRLRIGRADVLDIWVNDRSISREHAEIRLEGENIRVFDLESANGMRVNGEETSSALLSAGDVLELGDVQFRYVPAGSSAPPEPVEVDFEVMSDRALAAKPKPWMAAAGVAAGVSIIALIALLGTFQEAEPKHVSLRPKPALEVNAPELKPEPKPTRTKPVPKPLVAKTSPVPSPDAQPAAPITESEQSALAARQAEFAESALKACQRALRNARWQEASEFAAQALAGMPDSSAALECRDRARLASKAQVQLDTANALYAKGRVEAAYLALGTLPPEAPQRKDKSFRRIQRGYTSMRLKEARAKVDEDPIGVAQELGSLLEDDALTSTQRKIATRLITRANKIQLATQTPTEEPIRVASLQEPDEGQSAANTSKPSIVPQRVIVDKPAPKPVAKEKVVTKPTPKVASKPKVAAKPAPKKALAKPSKTKVKAKAKATVAAAPKPAPPKPAPDPAPATETPKVGFQAARACLARGDNACVIRALENGQAKSPAALALLIETYRNTGNTTAALLYMRIFVRRYEEDRRAPRYRQLLEKQGQ